MRVFHSTIGTVRDGQLESAVAVAGEAAKLVGSHGGDVRFFMAGPGSDINSTLFSIEYDSPEALGRAFDELLQDVELQALMARLNQSSSPSQLTSQTMGMELPLPRTPKAGRGSIVEAHTSQVHPGRIEDVIEESAEVCNFVESNGAVNARLLQLTYAGIASGMIILIWELENMQAQARLGSAWYSNAGLALQAKAMSTNPASTRVSSQLWTEVPL